MLQLAYLVLHMFDFPILISKLVLHIAQGGDEAIELALTIIFVKNVEGGNEVNDLVLFFDWMDPPIVHDEFQLRDLTIAVGDFGVLVKGLTHDCDQHVQQMDTHEQRKEEEKSFENT